MTDRTPDMQSLDDDDRIDQVLHDHVRAAVQAVNGAYASADQVAGGLGVEDVDDVMQGIRDLAIFSADDLDDVIVEDLFARLQDRSNRDEEWQMRLRSY